jgi:hypothetical protein
MTAEEEYRECLAPHVLANPLWPPLMLLPIISELVTCMVLPIIYTLYRPDLMGTSILATSKPRDQHQNRTNQPAHHRNPRISTFASACKKPFSERIVVSLTRDATQRYSQSSASTCQLHEAVMHLNKSSKHLVDMIVRQPHGIFAEPMEANTGTTKATSGQAPLIVFYTMSLMPFLA